MNKRGFEFDAVVFRSAHDALLVFMERLYFAAGNNIDNLQCLTFHI
jgi:hypothetical protein